MQLGFLKTMKILSLMPCRSPAPEDAQNVTQALAHLLQLCPPRRSKGKRRLLTPDFATQLLAGAGDGKALFVKQFLDTEDVFHVHFSIHSLAGAALGGLELRELCLPEAQHVAGQAAEPADFPNAEVELVRNDNFLANGFPCGVLCGFMHGPGRSG